MSTYWERYSAKKRAGSVEPQERPQTPSHSGLEDQIFAITEKIAEYDTWSEKFEQLQSQIAQTDDKVISAARLIKLQQSYTETQEEEFMALKARVDELSGAKPEMVGRSDKESERLVNFVKRSTEHIDQQVARLEEKIDERPTTQPADTLNFSQLQSLETELQKQLQAIDQLRDKMTQQNQKISHATIQADTAEATCSRLADDCLSRVQEIMSQTEDLETLAMATAEEVRNWEPPEASNNDRIEDKVDRLEIKLQKYINQQKDLQLTLQKPRPSESLDRTQKARPSPAKAKANRSVDNLKSEDLFERNKENAIPPAHQTQTPAPRKKSSKLRRVRSANTSLRSLSPTTVKSRARDNAIKTAMIQREEIVEKPEKIKTKKTPKKRQSRRSKLEQIYQDMSLKASKS